MKNPTKKAILEEASLLLSDYKEYVGEEGQKIKVSNQLYYIGDVVRLVDTKLNLSAYYQIVFGSTLQVVLKNQANGISNPNQMSHANPHVWYNMPFIPLFKIIKGRLPYVKMERIGNDRKSLQLVKPKKWKR
jgi:hypothetical protein